MKNFFFGTALLVLFSISAGTNLQAQADRPEFVTITTTHFNLSLANDPTASMEKWIEMNKEYMEKVTRKNQYIFATNALQHFFTADNTEMLYVTAYSNWGDIERSEARDEELAKAAWPNDDAREAFMTNMGRYTINHHSDEIYATMPGAKLPAHRLDSTMVVYVRKNIRAYPADGSREEFEALHKEYSDKIYGPEAMIKAYYPLRHAWGSDNREVLDVFVVSSLCDIEQMRDSARRMAEKAWPNENDRKAFMDKYNRYFTGEHGDYIYHSLPAFQK